MRIRRLAASAPESTSPRRSAKDALTLSHLAWIPAGALVGWLASFVFGDVLTLPVDLYYAIYFTIVIGLALMQGVLARPETAHLSGGMLVWAVAYRGLLYGSVDGLLLFAFPWIVAWSAFGAEGGAWSLRLGASGVAFAAMLLITTTYHLGYGDFRSSKIVMPNVGSTIGAVPTLVAANPVASVIGHAIMHVTSVVHSPGSDLFLPPHREPEGGLKSGLQHEPEHQPPSRAGISRGWGTG